ncbi:MAG: CNNM domain-containing protein [Thermoleophilia bacterium]|nr:CNNM domain-containing protein [Thermoleophilia bacterium]
MSDVLGVVAVFFLVLLNAFFVAAEFAIVKVRSTRVAELAAEGKRRAKVADSIVGHLDAYLSATQLGITMASLGLGWVGEPALSHLIETP